MKTKSSDWWYRSRGERKKNKTVRPKKKGKLAVKSKESNKKPLMGEKKPSQNTTPTHKRVTKVE